MLHHPRLPSLLTGVHTVALQLLAVAAYEPPEPVLHFTGEPPLLPGLPQPRQPLRLLPLGVQHDLAHQRSAVLSMRSGQCNVASQKGTKP